MTFGLQLSSAAGVLEYSSDDVTWNQVDFFLVPANGSASNTYPQIDGREVLLTQMFIDSPPTDRKAIAHALSASGTTVSASGGSENSYVLVLMR